jgi:Glycosyl transferase family 11
MQQPERRYAFLRDVPLERHIKTLYLVGYWHTHIMVEEVADELRSELALKEPAQGKNLEVLEQINQCGNPVSLHVRRGDCTVAATARVALPFEYYSNAISTFKERLVDPTFFVFSDDIPFVKEYLPQNIATVFVEHNDDFSAHEDMRLMSSCHHHIIANSTFSWWGAWLSPRSDKMVIAPKHWDLTEDSYYPDLLPQTWMLADVATDPRPVPRSLSSQGLALA